MTAWPSGPHQSTYMMEKLGATFSELSQRWKLSTRPFRIGLPGTMQCHSTLLASCYFKTAMLVSSVPLSETTMQGYPRISATLSSTRATRWPERDVSTIAARYSRLKSSITFTMRNLHPGGMLHLYPDNLLFAERTPLHHRPPSSENNLISNSGFLRRARHSSVPGAFNPCSVIRDRKHGSDVPTGFDAGNRDHGSRKLVSTARIKG